MDRLLQSRKGVIQGETIAYVIGILPLIKPPNRELTDVIKTWYEDDAKALGTFAIINTYFHSLTGQGTGCGYYKKTSKSVLILHLDNLEAGKLFGTRHGFKV